MLFCRKHFKKQCQPEIWFEIITISVFKRSLKKIKIKKWKTSWVKSILLQNLYITHEKQCLLYRQPPLYGLSPLFYIMILSFSILWFFKNLNPAINKTLWRHIRIFGAHIYIYIYIYIYICQKLSFFTKKRFYKMRCMQYHHCLIIIIIISSLLSLKWLPSIFSWLS